MNIEIILASLLFAVVGAAVGFFVKNSQVQKEIKLQEGKAADNFIQ